MPWGEVSADWAIDQQITELVVHAWDIAKASGQSTDLDPDVGQAALTWAKAQLLPAFRGDEADGYHLGPEIRITADAPLYDQIAAFGGRDPHYPG